MSWASDEVLDVSGAASSILDFYGTMVPLPPAAAPDDRYEQQLRTAEVSGIRHM